MRIENFDVNLAIVIEFYIENAMKKHDWEVVAIDTNRNRLVLKRYDFDCDKEDEPRKGGI